MIPYCRADIIKSENGIIFLFVASSFKLQPVSHLAQSVWSASRSYFVTLILTVLRLVCVTMSALGIDCSHVSTNFFATLVNAKIYYGWVIPSPISQNISLYGKDALIPLEQEAISGL